MIPDNAAGRAARGEAPGPETSTLRLDRFQRTAEMGRRVAEFDWASTPVGPLERWSRSFHATVSTLLGSRYPMMLLWGDDLLELYNDACIPLIGDKHPQALGVSVRTTLAEGWGPLAPLNDGV